MPMDALLTRDAESTLDLAPAPISVLAFVSEELVWCGIRLMLGRPPWLGRYLVAPDLEGAARLAAAHRPEVVLVDMKSAGVAPEEACAVLRLASPESHLLLLSTAPFVPASSV